MAASKLAMTPQEALTALGNLPRYEETLTARAGGMTSMVWGLASAGIFLTYATAGDFLEAHEAYWGFALLWMPWVAAGIALTGAIWRSHAVSLRRNPETRRGVGTSLLFTLLFLVIGAGLFGILDVAAGVEWSIHTVMTMASGLFAVALGVIDLRGRNCGARDVILAGVAMTAAGSLLGLSGAGDTVSALLGAAVVGSAWMTAGLVTYAQG